MDHAFAGGATGGHHAARRGRGRPTGLSLTWTHAVGALVARSSKECPVRPCRAGSPYPASLGETAGSGDPALQPTASSRLSLPSRFAFPLCLSGIRRVLVAIRWAESILMIHETRLPASLLLA